MGLLTYCMRDRPEKNMERSKVEREYHSMIQNMDDEERDRTWEEVLATGYRDPRKAHKPYVCKQSEEREKGEDNWLAGLGEIKHHGFFVTTRANFSSLLQSVVSLLNGTTFALVVYQTSDRKSYATS